MATRRPSLMSFIKDNGGIVRYSSVIKAGYHPDSLTALESGGKIRKIGRGLYRLSDIALSAHPDLVAVSLQAPRGVVCLVSALAFHEVTDEIPKRVDVAIPRGSRANTIHYPPVRYYRFSKPAWESGIEEHRIEGRTIRVYSLAKTIADCFKFRNRIGMDVVLGALKTARSEKKVKIQDILRFAKTCRVDGVIKPILENSL